MRLPETEKSWHRDDSGKALKGPGQVRKMGEAAASRSIESSLMNDPGNQV